MDTTSVSGSRPAAPAERITPVARVPRLWPQYVVVASNLAALVLWVTSLPLIDTDNIGDTGLVSVLPARFFLALALVSVSFAVSVRTGLRARWRILHVAVLVLVVHGTLPLVYDEPRFAYVYKHLGVVELVSRYGSVDRTVDAYNNWPGFFLLNAYFREAAGLRNSVGYTPWAPVFFNLCFALVLYFAYRRLVADEDMRWWGIWLFLLGNWVGQDYLAPQAFGFLLSMTIIGISVAWLRTAPPGPPQWLKRLRLHPRPLERAWLGARWRDRLRLLSMPVPRPESPSRPAPPIGGQWTAVGLVLVLFAAVVASHQLTPIMTVAAVTALVLLAGRRPWWLPLVMAAMTAAWFEIVAGNFLSAHLYLIGDVGRRPDSAVSAQLSNLTTAPGQVFVASTSRAVTATLWLLAGVGLAMRWRRGHRDVALVALAVSPLPLLAAVMYGGEMLLRVYFFSLPWIALLAGAAVAELCRTRQRAVFWRAWPTAVAALLSFTLVVGLCVAAFGQEKSNHIREGEVQASAWFYEHARDASLMMLVDGNFPSRLEGNYARFEVQNFFSEPRYHNHDFIPEDVPRLVRVLEADTRASMGARGVKQGEADAYVIISKSQVNYAELYRLATPQQIASLEAVLASSNAFELVYANEDARIYQLTRTISP